jgi:hypothetical protein
MNLVNLYKRKQIRHLQDELMQKIRHLETCTVYCLEINPKVRWDIFNRKTTSMKDLLKVKEKVNHLILLSKENNK